MADKDKTIDPFDVEALEKSLNDSATRVSTIWVSFLIFSLYLLTAATTVTHRQLFLAEPVKLPVLNIDLPLWGFFFLAPILFVIFHAYVLIQVILLARTAASYDDAVKKAVKHSNLSPEEEASLRQRLANTLFAQIFGGSPRERYGWLGWLLKAMAWTTLAVAPIVILLAIQFMFLPYHGHLATWTHRLLVLLELGIIFLLWPAALDTKLEINWSNRRRRVRYALALLRRLLLASRVRQERAWLRLKRRRLPILTSLAIGGVSLLLATFPGELHVNLFTGSLSTAAQCERWFSSTFDRLEVPRLDVVDDEVLAKIEKATAEKRLGPSKGERTRNFRDRDFACADLSHSDLRRVDLTGARMMGANLREAELQGASLDVAELQKATLDRALLQDASLERARLQAASLKSAQLTGALLDNAQLEGASLDNAQFENASLNNAKLRRASLAGANFRRASLNETDLRGTRLEGADLQEASLRDSDLRGIAFREIIEGFRTNPKFGRVPKRVADEQSFLEKLLQEERAASDTEKQQEVLDRLEREVELRIASGRETKFVQATLSGARLQGMRLDGADFTGAMLDRAELQAASLVRAKLQGASLDSAQLQSANLTRADLRGASLKNAMLQGASLEGANLQGASLDSADLRAASLTGADLRYASLLGVQVWNARGATCMNALVRVRSFDLVANLNLEHFIDGIVANIIDSNVRELEKKRLEESLNSSNFNAPAVKELWAICNAAAVGLDRTDFDERRAKTLRDLTCNAGADRRFVAHGIIRNWISDREDQLAFSAMLARGLVGVAEPVCAVTKDLDEPTKQRLYRIAAAVTKERPTPSSVPTETEDEVRVPLEPSLR